MAETTSRLSGNQDQVVDSKNRLVIPAKFRELLGPKVKVGLLPLDGFYVLMVSSPDVYKTRMDVLERRAETNLALINTLTVLEGMTEELELDEQGRITLTAELKGFAGLERDVVVLGRGDHLQIWTKGRWDDFRRGLLERPRELRENMHRPQS